MGRAACWVSCGRSMARVALLLGLVLSLAERAPAQIPPPLDLPGERPDEIPIPQEEAPILPPLPPEPPPPLLPTLRVRIDEIRVVGNSVLPAVEIERVVSPYVAQELASGDLQALRDALTRLYVERGYVTSGATLPDQDFAEGVLLVRILEGRIESLRITGQRQFRERYLRPRILPDPDAPVNVHELEERLQRLQRDPQIEAVHAELRPGLRLGESILKVRIVETHQVRAALDVSNHRTAALGDVFGRLGFDFRNAAGWGDDFSLEGRFGEGLTDLIGSYSLPITASDTRLALGFRWAESEVVESPFDALDIESEFASGGFEVEHPLWRTLRDELTVGLRAEWRRGKNELDGFGFSFSEGADEGESIVVPLRPFVAWVRREPNQVVALRGQVSFGLPILDATDVRGAKEDATFVAGLVQGQWARRFPRLRGTEALVRLDLQLVDSPLLPIEQFSVGGHASVRGYRENERVNDNGFALSFDLRFPLWRRPDGRPILQVIPFTDVARGWDDGDRRDSQGDTLASVGAGLRWFPVDWLHAELYWGRSLIHVSGPSGGSAQDDGIHFMLKASL